MSILEARERRGLKMKALTSSSLTWITIKANAISSIRLHPLMSSMVVIAYDELLSTIPLSKQEATLDAEGLVIYVSTTLSGKEAKKRCVSLEENHPIGRLVDLDVFEGGCSISRSELGIAPRLCFLCEQMAAQCVRSKTHDISLIEAYSLKEARDYLLKTQGRSAMFGMVAELTRLRTYGCVGVMHSGVHVDMDFFTYLASMRVLWHQFDLMDHQMMGNFTQLRAFGQRIEAHMFEATYGKNTHKGAIFLFLFAISADMAKKSIQKRIEHIRWLASEVKKDFDQTPLTYGLFASKSYSIVSIRHLVLDGLSWVYQTLVPKIGVSEDELMANIISCIDDTTTLKRSDLATLRFLQSWAKELLSRREYDSMKELDDYYMKHRLSSGGCADIYALAYYIALREGKV